MTATIYALAVLGGIFLTILGAAFFVILFAAVVRGKQETRPPYEGDAGDEDTQGLALYGEPPVYPRSANSISFEKYLTDVDYHNTMRNVNVHNN